MWCFIITVLVKIMKRTVPTLNDLAILCVVLWAPFFIAKVRIWNPLWCYCEIVNFIRQTVPVYLNKLNDHVCLACKKFWLLFCLMYLRFYDHLGHVLNIFSFKSDKIWWCYIDNINIWGTTTSWRFLVWLFVRLITKIEISEPHFWVRDSLILKNTLYLRIKCSSLPREPIFSTVFASVDYWKIIWSNNLNLLLSHSRRKFFFF